MTFPLLHFLKRYQGQALAGLIAITAVNAVQLFIPQVVRRIIDSLASGEAPSMHWATVTLATLIALVSALRYLWRVFLFGMSRAVRSDIRRDITEAVLRSQDEPQRKKSSGEILTHFMSDADTAAVACGTGLLFFADASFLLIFSLIAMATIHLTLTIVSALPLVLIAVAISVASPIIRGRTLLQQQSFSFLAEAIATAIARIRVVKAHSRENEVARSLQRASLDYREHQESVARATCALEPWAVFVTGGANIIALVYGAMLVREGSITIGDFAVFTTYLTLVAWPMSAIGHLFSMLQKGNVSALRVKGLLDDLNSKFASLHADAKPTRQLLQLLESANNIAVIGATGSGKSTLARSLHYSQESNGIFLPALNGIVTGTVRENLELFVGEQSEASLWSALEAVSLADEVAAFSQRLETPVGEGGVTLSGGQRQRLALARLFLAAPAQVIIDEPLSAVDRRTEDRIWLQLHPWLRARKSVVFTSKASVAARFSLVAVMSHYEISDTGNPRELASRAGVFQTLQDLERVDMNVEESSC